MEEIGTFDNTRKMILEGEENPKYPMGTFTWIQPNILKQQIVNAIKKLLDYDIDESEIELEFFDYPIQEDIPGVSHEEITAFRAYYKGKQIGLFDLFVLLNEFHGMHLVGHLNYDRPSHETIPEVDHWYRYKSKNLKEKEEYSIFVVV